MLLVKIHGALVFDNPAEAGKQPDEAMAISPNKLHSGSFYM